MTYILSKFTFFAVRFRRDNKSPKIYQSTFYNKRSDFSKRYLLEDTVQGVPQKSASDRQSLIVRIHDKGRWNSM